MTRQLCHFGIPECGPTGMALEDWARQPFSDTPPATPPKAATEALMVASWPKLLACTPANSKRLRTPSRQRAAFLRQLERCGSAAEAATRAGVNRGTLYRWRARDPRFAAKWDAAVACQAAEAADSIALQANKIDIQPVFYRGKQIAERRRINTRLLIHVQNRLDTDRRRAEDRAEHRELLLLRAELAERSFRIRQAATPAATPDVPEMCSEDLGLPAAA